MADKHYGILKTSYVVKAKSGGRIEVYVHHDHKGIRHILKNHVGNPRELLVKYEKFDGENPRAAYWLSEVVRDYKSYFERNAVDIIFP